MAIRANVDAEPRPLRWLGHAAVWTLVAAAAVWLKSRRSSNASVSPLSADWLQDLERQSIRTRDL